MTEGTLEATVPQLDEENAASGAQDYWGTDETHKHMLPDGVQWFEFKIMNEGDKSKFQKLTNSDLVVDRNNTARVKMDPVAERHTLIKTSLIAWNLYKSGESILFSKQMLEKWLEVAPPKVVEDLEFAIRMANPWMQADQKVEDIDKEIERLYEQRKQAVERESGEAASATK